MKPEIKQRIEQIKAGQVPNGYKKTKVGIVLEEWDIRKLKETLEKQTMKNKGNIVKNVLTNSATKGIISQTDFFDKQIANNDNTSGYYVVKNGYFVYNPRISASAPCGPFNKYYGNKDGIMSPLYTVYKYKSASECYSEFLSLYFSGSSWYSYMNGIANYGARNDRMNVSSEDMDNMPLPFPPLAEQQKIVKILSTQDKLIELQQRKISQLQKLKKIYLNKMFSKKGDNVPEWRFNGFTDAWEQRKLGEVFNFHYGDGNNNPSNGGQYPVFGAGGIQGGYTKYNAENSVIIGHMGDAGCVSWGEGKHFVTYNGTITKPKDDVFSAKFGYYLLLNMNLRKYRGGSGLPFLTYDMLTEMETQCPNSKMETQKIADYFTNLDRLITLHQCKLDEENQKKKSLMQLLLTGIVRCKQ